MERAASNQPEPRTEVDPWLTDAALRRYSSAFGADEEALARAGAVFGTREMREAGRRANRHPPELHRYDRAGRRVDRVEFHPAYHDLMEAGISHGYAAVAWEGPSGGHATHAALVYMMSQVEPGVCCPMTMTYAAVPALDAAGELARLWRPRLTGRNYDRSFVPAESKTGATIGMAMTEKQGGSDVRSNVTRAEVDGEGYRLHGHKWFCSAPMSDAFLTLAQANGGLTCFLVERFAPDGTLNPMRLERLKDKLGNRANASAEIEYHGAFARRLGAEGAGVRTIINMVHHTRLDTALAPAGLMRAALSEALWWTGGRTVFGRALIDQPLMRRVLADLTLDAEAALALGMRVAAAFDAGDAAFARIAVALAKYVSNKRAPQMIYECMECLGGMGFVEETPMPLLYREAPLNSIWEGSGNVIALDILRTLALPESRDSLMAELEAGGGANRAYDECLRHWLARWAKGADEAEARRFAEETADLLAASVLIRYADGAVSDGFVASRALGRRGGSAGTVEEIDADAILG